VRMYCTCVELVYMAVIYVCVGVEMFVCGSGCRIGWGVYGCNCVAILGTCYAYSSSAMHGM